MSQTLGNSSVHIIFSTKNREPYICEELELDLYAYISGICKSLQSPVHIINGVSDHIHILLEQHKTVGISEIVSKIKSNSSRWLKGHKYGDPNFSWQCGYGYFVVGRPQFETVSRYILKQKEHHKKIGFQDEMRLVYAKTGIVIDERYIWD
jgi:REP element-mobilizing transposase RayT